MRLRFGNIYLGGFYHIYNRGVDKRIVFVDKQDADRFLFLLDILNSSVNIKNLNNLLKGDLDIHIQDVKNGEPLVRIHAFAVVKNHYHLIVEQVRQDGVSTFMQKLGTAYTKYFNARHDRSGALFQGKFKYGEIMSDNQFLRLVSYTNLNLQVHHAERSWTSFSSEGCYLGKENFSFCDKKYAMDMFGSITSYKSKSRQVVADILRSRDEELLLEKL